MAQKKPRTPAIGLYEVGLGDPPSFTRDDAEYYLVDDADIETQYLLKDVEA